jgi:hypothetical protein
MAPPLTVGKMYLLLGPSPSKTVKVLEMRSDGWARVIEQEDWGSGGRRWARNETWLNINAYTEISGPYDEQGNRAR